MRREGGSHSTGDWKPLPVTAVGSEGMDSMEYLEQDLIIRADGDEREVDREISLGLHAL